MKKIIQFVFFVISLVGCETDNPICSDTGNQEELGPDEDWIYESSPRNVYIIPLDACGNNYCDPDFARNFLDNDITATYNGKTYRLNKYPENQTRDVSAEWHGLRLGKYRGYSGDKGTPAMVLGEFYLQRKPSDEYDGETFAIDWGDGKTADEFKFQFYWTWALWTENSGFGRPDKHPATIPVTNVKIWANGRLANENELMATIELKYE